jgi:hypothetical protein
MERFEQYASLQFGVKRDTEVVPHRPRQENDAGRRDFFGDVFSARDGSSRNSSGLDRALDQSNGLMTDRSSRSQQRDVGACLPTHGFAMS